MDDIFLISHTFASLTASQKYDIKEGRTSQGDVTTDMSQRGTPNRLARRLELLGIFGFISVGDNTVVRIKYSYIFAKKLLLNIFSYLFIILCAKTIQGLTGFNITNGTRKILEFGVFVPNFDFQSFTNGKSIG